jgi:predicted membrane protein
LFLIAIGSVVLLRAVYSRRHDPAGEATPVSTLNEWVVLGGGKLKSNAANFRGGDVLAMLGGYEIDLTKAGIQENEVVVNATALFGGVVIRVPESWSVTLRGTPILGGLEDNTYHSKVQQPASDKRLIVKGLVVCGGLEVNN